MIVILTETTIQTTIVSEILSHIFSGKTALAGLKKNQSN